MGLFELKESYALGAFNLMSWLWLIPGLIGIGGFVSDFRKKRIIRIEEDEILIGFSMGKSSAKMEPITSIDRDQMEYHLYSEKSSLSIRIKRLPEDFRELFDARCDAGLE